MGAKARARDDAPDRGTPVPRRAGRLTAGVPAVPHPEIERVFREQYGRAVAVLVRVFGDIDLAEEAVQDAFTTAVASWPGSGLPPAPAGWIITKVAKRARRPPGRGAARGA